MRGVSGLILVAAVALAAAGAGGSRLAAPRTGLFEIGADGTSQRLLLGDPGLLLDLSPSRDAALIVRQSAGGFDLKAVELATGRERLLVRTTSWIVTGAWSPSGKTIAFDTAGERVFLVAAGGTVPRLLASRARQPAWAPDSRRLVYVGSFDSSSQRGVLTVARSSGRGRWRLGRHGKIVLPRWSPDGRWIAYLGASGGENSGAVSLIRVDGRGLRRFVVGSDLAWSRGGRYVAFVHRTDGRARLDVLARRTGRIRHLASGWDLAAPAWSPDGKSVAFVRYTGSACGSETELDLVQLRGGAARTVTPLPQCVQVSAVFWSRDGRNLFYVAY
jgi:Tol biopolymer transport system component